METCSVCISSHRSECMREWPAECRHRFCASCSADWLSRHTTCPMCRSEATGPEVEYLAQTRNASKQLELADAMRQYAAHMRDRVRTELARATRETERSGRRDGPEARVSLRRRLFRSCWRAPVATRRQQLNAEAHRLTLVRMEQLMAHVGADLDSFRSRTEAQMRRTGDRNERGPSPGFLRRIHGDSPSFSRRVGERSMPLPPDDMYRGHALERAEHSPVASLLRYAQAAWAPALRD
jgi:hypothetical protein